MTFYHLHHTDLRINLIKHRHRISSLLSLFYEIKDDLSIRVREENISILTYT